MSYALADFPEWACQDPNAYSPPGSKTCICRPGYGCAGSFVPGGSCHNCVAQQTASTGVADAAARASCSAQGGRWADGWCMYPNQGGAPSSSGGGGEDPAPSDWQDPESSPSTGGGGSWYGGGGDGETAQAGMSTMGWFVVAAGIAAVGLFAYDAMTGAGIR